jgi:hypothetical protein
MHGLVNQFRAARAFLEKLGQEHVENPEPFGWYRRLAQSVYKARANPHIIQSDGPLKKQIGTLTEQPCKSSRLEQNPRQALPCLRYQLPCIVLAHLRQWLEGGAYFLFHLVHSR